MKYEEITMNGEWRSDDKLTDELNSLTSERYIGDRFDPLDSSWEPLTDANFVLLANVSYIAEVIPVETNKMECTFLCIKTVKQNGFVLIWNANVIEEVNNLLK